MINKPMQMHFIGIYYNLIYDTFQSVKITLRVLFKPSKKAKSISQLSQQTFFNNDSSICCLASNW